MRKKKNMFNHRNQPINGQSNVQGKLRNLKEVNENKRLVGLGDAEALLMVSFQLHGQFDPPWPRLVV